LKDACDASQVRCGNQSWANDLGAFQLRCKFICLPIFAERKDLCICYPKAASAHPTRKRLQAQPGGHSRARNFYEMPCM